MCIPGLFKNASASTFQVQMPILTSKLLPNPALSLLILLKVTMFRWVWVPIYFSKRAFKFPALSEMLFWALLPPNAPPHTQHLQVLKLHLSSTPSSKHFHNETCPNFSCQKGCVHTSFLHTFHFLCYISSLPKGGGPISWLAKKEHEPWNQNNQDMFSLAFG